MIAIDRSELGLSNIAGGARKQTTVDLPDCTPTPATTSGSASSVVTINGKEVINNSVSF